MKRPKLVTEEEGRGLCNHTGLRLTHEADEDPPSNPEEPLVRTSFRLQQLLCTGEEWESSSSSLSSVLELSKVLQFQKLEEFEKTYTQDHATFLSQGILGPSLSQVPPLHKVS